MSTNEDDWNWEDFKDDIFKIMVIGPSGVGKTQMVQCYVNRKRTLDPENTPSTETIQCEVEDTRVDSTLKYVQVFDTSGAREEDTDTVAASYYSAMNAFIFVFNLTESARTLEELTGTWIPEVKAKANVHAKFALIGNKVDREDAEVDYDKAIKFAEV